MIHHHHHLHLLFFVLFFLPVALNGIRLEHVEVPSVVAVGESATMTCEVDLERDDLYSVKWYKDGEEFYQWKPKGTSPNVKTYPVEGIQVDREKSAKETVVLRAVTPATAGFFRCEASGEGPAFRSASGGGHMSVVILPRKKPEIFGGFTGMEEDTLELNCTTDGSRPAAQIRWLINNLPVNPRLVLETSVSRTSSGLETTFSVLEVPSRDSHLSSRAGPVTVTCEAAIPYQRNQSLWSAGMELNPASSAMQFQRRVSSGEHTQQDQTGERMFRSRAVASHETLRSLTLRKEIIIYVNGADGHPTPAQLLSLATFVLVLIRLVSHHD